LPGPRLQPWVFFQRHVPRAILGQSAAAADHLLQEHVVARIERERVAVGVDRAVDRQQSRRGVAGPGLRGVEDDRVPDELRVSGGLEDADVADGQGAAIVAAQVERGGGGIEGQRGDPDTGPRPAEGHRS